MMVHPVGSFEDVRQALKPEAETDNGPYYCYYPSFLDCCMILARMAERSGQSVYLLLCTLTEKSGKEFRDSDKLEEQMELFKRVIGETFRKGDLYTKYSRSQFLVILSGTELENGILAFNRLRERWESMEGAHGTISYSLESLLNLRGIEKKKKSSISWGDSGRKWGN